MAATKKRSSARKTRRSTRSTSSARSPRKISSKRQTRKKVLPMEVNIARPQRAPCSGNWFLLLLSELSLYGFLFYLIFLLGVASNPYFSSFLLWLLLNLSYWFCPKRGRCY